MGSGSSRVVRPANPRPIGQKGALPPKSLEDGAVKGVRDWNEEYQKGVEMIEKEDFINGYALLASVTADFHDTATRFAEVIVSELSLVAEDKTFLPTLRSTLESSPEFTRYEVQNIEFNIAHGGQGTESWQELGNELRHSLTLMRCKEPGICLPLMCVFDFKGFRVLCQAKLPKPDKLLLGWDATLKGFVLESTDLQVSVGNMGRLLNLARHKIGTGELAVSTHFHSAVRCFQVGYHGLLGGKTRAYCVGVKDLLPTELSKGGLFHPEAPPPEVHSECPYKLRPEFLRRYTKPLSPDVNLYPPKAKPAAKYKHDGSAESLGELMRAVRHLMKLVVIETVDGLYRVLKGRAQGGADGIGGVAAAEEGEPDRAREVVRELLSEGAPPEGEAEWRTDAANLSACMAHVHGEGLNIRFLGLLRSKINVHSREPAHGEIRRLLLHEMVARVLKVSMYKILRQANGYGKEESVVDAIRGQTDVEHREVQTPFLPTAGQKRRAQREMKPSNEACRSALVSFFNVVFARQFIELKQAPLRKQLEEQGMEVDQVEQVLTLARLVADIKKSNKENFPSAVEHTVTQLKKEMATIVRAAMPGGAWMLERVNDKRAQQVHKKEAQAQREAEEQALADKLLSEALPDDPFSVYWRETMRALIVQKWGEKALSPHEHARDWSVIEHIDTCVVLKRLEELTGLCFASSAFDRVALVREHPSSPAAVVQWYESDIESLGPKVKHSGVASASRGWQLIHRSRTLARGAAKRQVLTLACRTFKEALEHAPNDWVAAYDYGCAVYELSWSSSAAFQYDLLREAFRQFRHSHKVCREWVPSMLRLGDTIYAMTLMRQDQALEEVPACLAECVACTCVGTADALNTRMMQDYVNLCVEASSVLDKSQDYAVRCGVWADQVYKAACRANGFRAQRLYTLAGVTYNEWIALKGSEEAVHMAWILEHHQELGMEPADVAAMVDLIRSTTPQKGLLGNLRRAPGDEAMFDTISFKNRFISDACLLLTSSRAPVASLQNLEVSNLECMSGKALLAVCEEHGQHLKTLAVTTSPKVSIEDLQAAVSQCYAEGFGLLQTLRLESVKGLDDQSMVAIAAKLPHSLTSLSLRDNVQLQDEGVLEVARNCTSLTELDLKRCERITDKSLLLVVHKCLTLDKLRIAFCPRVTDAAICQLAYRARRIYTGKPGIPGKGAFNHDDPTLVLADLVIKNRIKKHTRKTDDDDDDDWGVFDEDVGTSDDPEAMHVFEQEQARRHRVQALKREREEQEFARVLKDNGLTVGTVNALFAKKGDESDEDRPNVVDLDEVAIRMGLEEPAERERRLRALEKAREREEEQERVKEAEKRVEQGMRPFAIAKELGMDIGAVRTVQEKFDLKTKEFVEIKSIRSEDLHKYAFQIKITECKVKKALLTDVNMQSRLFLRMVLTSGGAVKNSGYKPVMSELKFNVDTYLPKVVDHNDFLKIDLCVKPDSGPGKALAYYKAPMPKVIDYPMELKQVPLFGSSGFFQGTPVGRMAMSFRIMSDAEFQDWKQSMEDYDPEAHKKKEDTKLKEDADKPGAVAEKVMDRVIEYAITHLLDFFAVYKQLDMLDLSHCTALTDYSVIEVVRSMPNLHTLDLDGVINVTDEALLFIGRLCPKLKVLSLCGCSQITDDGLVEIASGCLELEEIAVDECAHLSDASIAFLINFDLTYRLRKLSYKGLVNTTEEAYNQIANSCSSLTHLSVAGSAQYRDVQLVQMAARCLELRTLDLSWCERFTDYSVCKLAEGCTRLTDLSLANCEGVGTAGITALARNCASITSLDLTGCTKVGDEAIGEIIKSLLQLSWMSISLCELLTKKSLISINDWGESLTSLEMLGCSSMSRKDIVRFKEKVAGRTHVVDEQDDLNDALYK